MVFLNVIYLYKYQKLFINILNSIQIYKNIMNNNQNKNLYGDRKD